MGRICRKGKFIFQPGGLGLVKSEGVMGDESGESMEVMEKVPLKELGESELERLVRRPS